MGLHQLDTLPPHNVREDIQCVDLLKVEHVLLCDQHATTSILGHVQVGMDALNCDWYKLTMCFSAQTSSGNPCTCCTITKDDKHLRQQDILLVNPSSAQLTEWGQPRVRCKHPPNRGNLVYRFRWTWEMRHKFGTKCQE